MTVDTAFLMTRVVLPIMKKQKYGRIVNVTSVTGPLVSNVGSGRLRRGQRRDGWIDAGGGD
jgi:NAD(P)-dependent dehydrogenase (short-subunit alcohol dehydrogenase family)